MKSKLQKKTKNELISIILQLVSSNPESRQLLHNLMNNETPSKDATLRNIEGELRYHTGSYRTAYKLFEQFVRTSINQSDILELTMESIGYFLEELALYHDYPDDLIDAIEDMFCKASEIAGHQSNKQAAKLLYQELDSANQLPDEILMFFYDALISFIPYEWIDEFDREAQDQ